MSDLLTAIFSNAPSRTLSESTFLFVPDQKVENLYFVSDGCIVLERYLETGAVTCLQRAQSNSILAEASVYSDRYHCAAHVVTSSVVKAVPVAEFHAHLRDNPDLAHQWARHLARTVQTMRFLSELRGMRTVADRLDAWLGENETLPEKGGWKSLASELAVSPEALYRELASRGSDR